MKAAYINPFVDAVRRLFQTMLTLPVTIGSPGLNREARPRHEICGVIGVTGAIAGQVVVSMPPSLAASLASELLGDTVEHIDDDCLDAVGEIANMIAGNAKTDFPENEGTISVPKVVVGSEKVAYPDATPVISIPCETDQGPLHIDVALKKGSH